MPGLADLKSSVTLQAMIVGKAKQGKTVGAATFPRPNFLSFDKDGMLSLINPVVEAKYKFSTAGIMYDSFVDRDTDKYGIINTHNALDDACRYFDACMSPKGVKYKSPATGVESTVAEDMFDTWVIDSGSSLSTACRNKSVWLLGGKDFKGNSSNTLADGHRFGLLLPKLQDFGAERSMLEQFINMVMNSGKHALLLCHEREKWEGSGDNAKMVGYTPLFTGQSADLIPSGMNEVYWLSVGKRGTETIRHLQTAPDSMHPCGSRLGLPDGTPFEYQAIKKALNL